MQSSKKKKVLFIGPFPPPFGGIANHTNLLFSSNLSSEFDLLKLNINLPEEQTEIISEQKAINYNKVFTASKKLYSYIKKDKPDLCYIKMNGDVSCFREYLFMLIIRLFSSAKIVLHFHGMYKENKRNFPFVGQQRKKWMNRFLLNLIFAPANKIIFLSNSLREEFIPQLKKNIINKSTFIDHFVVVDNFDDKVGGGENINILFMGRLSKAKGFFELIDIIPEIVKEFSNVKFHACGEKERENSLDDIQDEIERLKTEGTLTLHGLVTGDKKREVFKYSDVLAFPSHTEVFPNTILEGLAQGLAIVTTNVGVVADVIKPNENGLYIEIGNAEQLKEQLLKLLRDKALFSKMAQSNKQLAKVKYDINIATARLTKIFNEQIEL